MPAPAHANTETASPVPTNKNSILPKLLGGSASVTKGEIPIAARLKGPGPAAYTLPSTFGEPRVGTRKAPAYSFGSRYRQRQPDVIPGPNAFFPAGCTRTGNARGPAFSLQGRFIPEQAATGTNENDVEGGAHHGYHVVTPGPNAYDPPKRPPRESCAPAYTITGRHRDFMLSKTPGPAEYALPSTIGTNQSTVRASAAHTMSAPQETKVEIISPGPAAYSALDPGKIKSAAPAYSLGSRLPEPEPGIELPRPPKSAKGAPVSRAPFPGPGQYTPKAPPTLQAPSFTFRGKHSEFELFVPDNVQLEDI